MTKHFDADDFEAFLKLVPQQLEGAPLPCAGAWVERCTPYTGGPVPETAPPPRPMPQPAAPRSAVDGWLHPLRQWLAGWSQIVRFGAQVLVLALSPSSYRLRHRMALQSSIYQATMPSLRAFTVLSALVGLVVIRIVLATSQSYGLSRYALDVLVRTLVLELIPLSAALFVAVRYALPAGDAVRALPETAAGRADGMQSVVLPRVLAGMFAVLSLALVSGVVVLVLTYLSVYGFSGWGLPGFTRTVGQVFNPVIALIFSLKTLFLSLAVAVIPMVTTPRERLPGITRSQADLTRLARIFAVALLIEAVSLVGNYH